MNLCFHTILQKVFLQSVALRTEDSENMIDTIARSEARARILLAINKPSFELCSLATNERQESYKGIAYFSLIASSNLLATLIIDIEMLQFYGKDGCLDLVDAGVIALIVVDIFLMTAVVAKGTDDVSQILVIGSDGPCVAKRTKVFTWVEAMGSSIA